MQDVQRIQWAERALREVSNTLGQLAEGNPELKEIWYQTNRPLRSLWELMDRLEIARLPLEGAKER